MIKHKGNNGPRLEVLVLTTMIAFPILNFQSSDNGPLEELHILPILIPLRFIMSDAGSLTPSETITAWTLPALSPP